MRLLELATLLNVSQAQIVEVLKTPEGCMPQYHVTVTRHMLESWKREMREAEMYLRQQLPVEVERDENNLPPAR
jgi:hypothetical protein